MTWVLTRGTREEVRIELDCTKTVAMAPIIMKTYPIQQGTLEIYLERNCVAAPARGLDSRLFMVFIISR